MQSKNREQIGESGADYLANTWRIDGIFVRFDAYSCTMTKSLILPMKLRLTRVATPLGFEPRITPPKGAVLPLHHGVIGWPTYDSRRRNGSCNSGGEELEIAPAGITPVAAFGNRERVALQSKSGTRYYSLGFGKRMSTVVPLP